MEKLLKFPLKPRLSFPRSAPITSRSCGDGALATLWKNVALWLVWIFLFLLVSVFLTALGFYFSWRQVHSPDWTRWVAVLLLLPYAAMNAVFHWLTGPQPLSYPVYQASLVLGTVLQLLYYYVLFRLLRRLFSAIWTRALGSPAPKGESK